MKLFKSNLKKNFKNNSIHVNGSFNTTVIPHYCCNTTIPVFKGAI